MAGEKNFENRLKDWLESEGIYPLGHPTDKMKVPLAAIGKSVGAAVGTQKAAFLICGLL